MFGIINNNFKVYKWNLNK